jgi:hypothetical protein
LGIVVLFRISIHPYGYINPRFQTAIADISFYRDLFVSCICIRGIDRLDAHHMSSFSADDQGFEIENYFDHIGFYHISNWFVFVAALFSVKPGDKGPGMGFHCGNDHYAGYNENDVRAARTHSGKTPQE